MKSYPSVDLAEELIRLIDTDRDGQGETTIIACVGLC